MLLNVENLFGKFVDIIQHSVIYTDSNKNMFDDQQKNSNKIE